MDEIRGVISSQARSATLHSLSNEPGLPVGTYPVASMPRSLALGVDIAKVSLCPDAVEEYASEGEIVDLLPTTAKDRERVTGGDAN